MTNWFISCIRNRKASLLKVSILFHVFFACFFGFSTNTGEDFFRFLDPEGARSSTSHKSIICIQRTNVNKKQNWNSRITFIHKDKKNGVSTGIVEGSASELVNKIKTASQNKLRFFEIHKGVYINPEYIEAFVTETICYKQHSLSRDIAFKGIGRGGEVIIGEERYPVSKRNVPKLKSELKSSKNRYSFSRNRNIARMGNGAMGAIGVLEIIASEIFESKERNKIFEEELAFWGDQIQMERKLWLMYSRNLYENGQLPITFDQFMANFFRLCEEGTVTDGSNSSVFTNNRPHQLDICKIPFDRLDIDSLLYSLEGQQRHHILYNPSFNDLSEKEKTILATLLMIRQAEYVHVPTTISYLHYIKGIIIVISIILIIQLFRIIRALRFIQNLDPIL